MIVHELAKDAKEDSLCYFYFWYYGIFHRIQSFSLLKMVILSTVKILIPTKYFCSLKSHNILEYVVLLCHGDSLGKLEGHTGIIGTSSFWGLSFMSANTTSGPNTDTFIMYFL